MSSDFDISKGRYWQVGIELVSGCTSCSPGCKHCWAAAMTHRFGAKRIGGGNEFFTIDARLPSPFTDANGCFNGHIQIHPERISIPLKRTKPTVYAVWNDLFHESVPVEFIDDALEVMAACPQHTFLVLTKRAHIMERKIYGITPENGCRELGGGDYLPNVYWGVTVCNQQEADEKIPVFLQVPGRKFLSLEPLLSTIDISEALEDGIPTKMEIIGTRGIHYIRHGTPRIGAVILGGETLGSKPGREMKLEWAESVVDQCVSVGVPVFVKQLHINGRVSKDMAEWPEKLRKRNLPWRKA